MIIPGGGVQGQSLCRIQDLARYLAIMFISG